MVLAVILLGALAFTVSGVFPFRQMLTQGQQIERANEQYAALVEENALLDEEIAALATEGEVERIARDQYGLVRPGETGYVVVVPDGAVPPEVDETATELVDDRAWWERIWDFVTGGDLADDG
jgi:cell division protein FtsB